MARVFDGTDDKLLYTTPSSVNSLTNVTIAFWLQRKGATGGGYGRYFQKANIANIGYLEISADDSTSRLGFQASWSGNNVQRYVTQPTQDVWTSVVATYDNGANYTGAHIYLDGTEPAYVVEQNGTGSRDSDTTDLAIGNRVNADNARACNAYQAEFAIWNRVLSAGEIAALAKGYSPRFFPSGLVFYVPMLGTTNEPSLMTGTTATVTGTTETDHPRIIYPSRPQAIFPPAAAAASANFFTLLGAGT